MGGSEPAQRGPRDGGQLRAESGVEPVLEGGNQLPSQEPGEERIGGQLPPSALLLHEGSDDWRYATLGRKSVEDGGCGCRRGIGITVQDDKERSRQGCGAKRTWDIDPHRAVLRQRTAEDRQVDETVKRRARRWLDKI